MGRGMRMGRLPAAGLACLTAVIVLTHGRGATAAVDDPAEGVQRAAGRWTLVLNETNRQCRLTLRSDQTAKMYRMGLPAGCRRAIPILSSVSGWTTTSSAVQFDDDDGKPVLEFTASGDVSNLVAKGPEGEVYSLVSADLTPTRGTSRVRPTGPPSTAAATSWETLLVAQADVPAAKPAKPEPAAAAAKTGAPTLDAIPGRYSILRKGGKDTGCMLNLDPKAKGPKGGKKANLAPACKDHGIVIFDPKGWRFEDGRLTLTAKKGHETHLDYQTDGTWLKDPKEGTPLSLKKS